MAFAAVALILALLVQRLTSLAGILTTLPAVILLRSSVAGRLRTHWIAGLVLVQSILSISALATLPLEGWYNPGLVRQLANSIRYIREELPPDGSIAADFVTSSAVLAQASHPVVLQPKYETARSRDRIERFTTALYWKSPSTAFTLLE